MLGAKDIPDNNVDSEYLQEAARLTHYVKQRSYELMQMQMGHKVLDVGCGPATDTIALAKLVGSRGEVIGIDYDEKMVIDANNKAKEAEVAEWAKHKQADATALPFEDSYFKSCRSERVFQHLLNPEQVLSEMTRVTQSGGWIIVIDSDWATLSVDTSEIEIERRLTQFKIDTYNNGFAGRQLYRLFKRQGLLNLTIELFGIPTIDYAIARQILRFDKLEKQAMEAGVITLEELERWQTSLEQADSEGVFFASGTQVMLAGQKP